MEDKIKQRILGALVLVGFVCVILSFLFHRSGPSVEEKITAQMNVPTQTVASNTSTTTSISPAAPATTTVAPVSTTIATTSTASTQTTTPVTTAVSNTTPSTTITTEPTEQPGVTSSTGTTANNTNNNATSVTNKLVAQASSNEANVDQIQAAAENAALQEMNQQSNKTALATTSTASPSTPVAPAPSSVASQQTSSATSNVNQSVTTEEPAQPSHVIKTAQSQAHTAHHHASLSGAWAIQVGVFSNTANAKTLVSKLRAKHFEAYVHHTHHNGKTLAIVFVGPEISKQKSLRVQAELKHAFHLHGIVKKYQM